MRVSSVENFWSGKSLMRPLLAYKIYNAIEADYAALLRLLNFKSVVATKIDGISRLVVIFHKFPMISILERSTGGIWKFWAKLIRLLPVETNNLKDNYDNLCRIFYQKYIFSVSINQKIRFYIFSK